MFEEEANKPCCATCPFWERDGSDGICYGGTPAPIITEAGKKYTLVWPRTNSDNRCPRHPNAIKGFMDGLQ